MHDIAKHALPASTALTAKSAHSLFLSFRIITGGIRPACAVVIHGKAAKCGSGHLSVDGESAGLWKLNTHTESGVLCYCSNHATKGVSDDHDKQTTRRSCGADF